jgi:peptidoglycan/xylan/chitin deacetylase (PgdA/CDA1 family)
MLAEHGCAPTFPTPGRVVERHAPFFRDLQSAGVEITVHSYDHVDLRDYSLDQAAQQLLKAADAFDRHQIEFCGFRCPYLGWSEDVLDVLPPGVFVYSSNKAIDWDTAPAGVGGGEGPASSAVLERLYQPASALDIVCTPWTYPSGIIEIPVCLPDDLELLDNLGLGPDGVTEAWGEILRQTHLRGELFVLMFHPELAWRCREPFAQLLGRAQKLGPHVWLARLCEIAGWWQESARFSVRPTHTVEGLQLDFDCTDRATILVKGLNLDASVTVWDGAYSRLRARRLEVPAQPRPFVGLPADAPERIVSFLREQGYILDTGDTAPLCATYLDTNTLAGLDSDVALIEAIEVSPGPLVRYWRWPDGAKSALCISGDLDALTLLDYADRLFAR